MDNIAFPVNTQVQLPWFAKLPDTSALKTWVISQRNNGPPPRQQQQHQQNHHLSPQTTNYEQRFKTVQNKQTSAFKAWRNKDNKHQPQNKLPPTP